MTFAEDSILVLLDVTPGGELAKSAAEVLGAAAQVDKRASAAHDVRIGEIGTPMGAEIVSTDRAAPGLEDDVSGAVEHVRNRHDFESVPSERCWRIQVSLAGTRLRPSLV